MAEEIIAFSTPRGDRRSEHFGCITPPICALIEGNCALSLELYRKSLVLARALGDRLETKLRAPGGGDVARRIGQAETAFASGFGARAECRRIGVDPHMRFWDELLDRSWEPRAHS